MHRYFIFASPSADFKPYLLKCFPFHIDTISCPEDIVEGNIIFAVPLRLSSLALTDLSQAWHVCSGRWQPPSQRFFPYYYKGDAYAFPKERSGSRNFAHHSTLSVHSTCSDFRASYLENRFGYRLVTKCILECHSSGTYGLVLLRCYSFTVFTEWISVLNFVVPFGWIL